MPLTAHEEIELIRLLEAEERDNVRNHHLNFMKYCWVKNKEIDPFIVGFHTQKICEQIDNAFRNFKKGISTYFLISVHFRSGKSDIVSRYLGPHFLGEFPDQEVMQVTYQANFAASFSSFGRNIMRTEKYQELYPQIKLSNETNKKNEWLIADIKNKNTGGKLYATGLKSGLTGQGFALGILDDYCSGREEAESLVQRDNAWEAFRDDFMTRIAPVGIVIILATQWHWDDINGRIRQAMKNDINFPQFEILSFPAKAKDYKGPGKYSNEYLFMERFSKKWYLTQYATLGRYSATALLDCNPEKRMGGQLSTAGIVYHDMKDFPDLFKLKWARIWDLAHTEKQRKKDDPDYTSGTLLAFEKIPDDPVLHLWVRNVKRFRMAAPRRDKKIKAIVREDGNFVKQAIENSIDSKDAYEYATDSMPDISWNKIPITGGDKTVRATPLESIFESPGHVHIARAGWNEDWLDEIIKFDGSGDEHDDQVDNLSAGYIFFNSGSIKMSEENKKQLAKRHRKR